MRDRRTGWVMWFLALLVSAYVVPYGLFGHFAKTSGAFLFWCIFAVVATVSIARMTSGWRDV